jgi:hypothetical protein
MLVLLGAGCGSASLKADDGAAGTGGSGAGDSGAGGAVPDGGAGSGAGGVTGTGGAIPDAGADRGATPDLAPDAPGDGGADAAGCGRPRTCNALHACSPGTGSGNYMIFPDGASDAGLLVFCDMTTGGGGWTVIYLADGVNLNSTAIGYTVAAQSLRDGAQQTLVGFRNLNLNQAISDWASFDLPASWRLTNPLAISPFEELTISVSVNGGLPGPALVRYGQANFGSLCSDTWTATPGDLYGRFCVQGTTASFFSGFTVNTADFCTTSNLGYSSRLCSDQFRFSIAVR